MYNDDWEDAVFQKSFRQEYNVTVSGATDKTDYFISAGYLSDPSYFVSSKFNAITCVPMSIRRLING